MTEDSIVVGHIVGIFGLRGELKCTPTNPGRPFFVPGASLECRLLGSTRQIRIEAVREHKGRLLITLDGINSASEAQGFVKSSFYLPKADVKRTLTENEYLDADLIGCTLQSVGGEVFGQVSDVQHYPASDMLIVNGSMVPLVQAFIKKINLSKKEIIAELPSGLFDDSDPIDFS